jgi:hypothetical protein
MKNDIRKVRKDFFIPQETKLSGNKQRWPESILPGKIELP